MNFFNLALIIAGQSRSLCYHRLYRTPIRARRPEEAALGCPLDPDERLAAALFRLLAARPGFAAAGLLALHARVCRLVAETPALAALLPRPAAAGGWPLPADRPAPARVDPAPLALAAGFAAVAADRGPEGPLAGYVVVADRRTRRLTPALALRSPTRRCSPRPFFAPPAPVARRRRCPAGPRGSRRSVRARPPTASSSRRSARAGAAAPAGLMIVDLDRFRAVNEALGPRPATRCSR